ECSTNKQDCGICCECNQFGIENYDPTQDSDCDPYDLPEIATCYNLIGNIWFEKGELDKALEYHTKSLALFEEIEDIHETAMSIHNIGNDYRHKGDADKAISYYERSLKLLEEIGNTFDISITLHNLIESSIRWKSVEAAQPYLQKLQEISEKEKDNKAINLIYRVSKAVILRKSDRVVTRAEAQQIFQQIAEEETVIHEHKYGAMLNLCEMLIEELRSSGDEEILDEINAVSKNMLAVAEDQNSFTKLVETYLIQSKMALIELNVDLSKQILGKAQQIAEEKGLQKHAIMISGEYDALLSQLSQWNELIDRNVSLIERLEMVELESMVSRMVRKKEEAPEIPEEEPTLFLILSKSGAIQFSKQFLTEKTLDDQVVSDLLTAINSFIQETFAATGSIERVKHKDHTLVMKPLAESLFCCYAFKGQSYAALHKLEKFIDTAKSKDTLWNVITSGQPLTEEKAVDELITEVFLTPFS
ncbi:MAG: tetratricopeptide repeat protein, partial [Candidatus Odinarchaeota archaeon]